MEFGSILHGVYVGLFAISVIYFILLMFYFKERISIFYVLLSVAIIISNFGYWQICAASTLDGAIFGNDTVHLGSSFVVFFMLLCIADLCRMNVPKIVSVLCVAVGLCLFIFTVLGDNVDFYYSELQLDSQNGMSVLVKEYGPAHIIYPLYLMALLCYGFIMVFLSLYKNQRASYIARFVSLVILALVIITYALQNALDLSFDLMPFAYDISYGCLIILLNRVKFYDVKGISGSMMINSTDYGFIIMDAKGRFTGGDERARAWFPELDELKIDSTIQYPTTDFLRQLKSWGETGIITEAQRRILIEQKTGDGALNPNIVHYERGDVAIEAHHETLVEYGNVIHCIALRDETQQRKYEKLIANFNEKLEEEVKIKTDRLEHVQDDIIISMASIVENRDNNTGGHIQRTSDVVRIFVNHLLSIQYSYELSPEVANCIIKAAPLHDFGKIAIKDAILNKESGFDDRDFHEMKKHSAKGAIIVGRILQNSDDLLFKNIAINVAHYHHEKWDGSGYPSGLKGNEIPFESRIMALADVFDAIVSKRVYKEKISYDEAFKIIEESSGTHFEPSLCREFLSCRVALEEYYNNLEGEE